MLNDCKRCKWLGKKCAACVYHDLLSIVDRRHEPLASNTEFTRFDIALMRRHHTDVLRCIANNIVP